MSKGTILFIHGAWMTPKCWEPFRRFFEGRGYECVAPTWPHKDLPIEQLRADPPEALARLGVAEIVRHYEQIVRGMAAPPIIVGHSFGGLFAQMLLDRGLGRAGVAIDPAPPRGVLPVLYPTAVRANLGVLATPFGWRRVLRMSLADFAYAFVHTLPKVEQERVYREHVVPETGRIFFQAALSPVNPATQVDFANDRRAPLLLIAGQEDRICPAAMIRATFARYRGCGAVTDLQEYPGRTHWIIAQDGHDEVAAGIDGWLERVLAGSPAGAPEREDAAG